MRHDLCPIRSCGGFDENRGVGVATCIRDSVSHKKICSISNKNLEALAIHISPYNTLPFILIVIYRNNKDVAIEPSFSNLLQSFLENGSDTDNIIMMRA